MLRIAAPPRARGRTTPDGTLLFKRMTLHCALKCVPGANHILTTFHLVCVRILVILSARGVRCLRCLAAHKQIPPMLLLSRLYSLLPPIRALLPAC